MFFRVTEPASSTRPRPVAARTGWGPGLLGGVALAVALGSPLQGQMSARPVIVHFAPDGPTARTERITNEGDRPLQLRLYPADYRQREDGSHVFQRAGTHERSCADRLSVFPDGATLEPGETLDARIEMEPGPRTCWSLVFVETVGSDTAGIHVGQRIGVKVYGLGDGAERAGELRSVEATRTPDGVRVSFVVANTGEVPYRPGGQIQIREPSGETVDRVQVEPFSVLPGSERRFSMRWAADLGTERYLVLPLLDIGAEYLLGGQAFLEPPSGSGRSASRSTEDVDP